jgi:hypothetical protein
VTTLKMRHRIGVAAAVAVILPMLSPLAAVAAPAEPQPFELTLPAGEVCTFPIRISGTSEQRYHDNPGVIAWTGPLTATITNLGTDKAETLNIPGPQQKDGTAVGPWLILQFASTHPDNHFMILNKGRVEFASDGTIAQRTGKMTDLCAAVA